MPEAEFNAWLINQSIEQRPLAVKANAVTTALAGSDESS
jgi:hypothetical protein